MSLLDVVVARRTTERKWWVYRGRHVSASDRNCCGAEGPEGYVCTLLAKHQNPHHVAHCFDEETGRPDEVMDIWVDDEDEDV